MVQYADVPIRPDSVRDDWEAYKAWVATLGPAARAIWEQYGNDDDGPWGQLIPGIMTLGGKPVGSGLILSPAQTQAQFEWWQSRNPWHNKHFFTDWKPVINPVYSAGRPKNRPDGSFDPRYEVNNFYVSRTNPPFFKFGWLFSGYRSDKPPWPAPAHWIKRPPYGGANDPLQFKSIHYP